MSELSLSMIRNELLTLPTETQPELSARMPINKFILKSSSHGLTYSPCIVYLGSQNVIRIHIINLS